MKYSGTGITVKKYNKDGNQVGDTETKTWSSLGINPESNKSWTYTTGDNYAYKYVIEYTTEVDTTGKTTQVQVDNTVTTDGGKTSTGSGTVTPAGGEVKLFKNVEKVDVQNMEITYLQTSKASLCLRKV